MTKIAYTMLRRVVLLASVAVVAGCATADRKPLVDGPTTATPSLADAAPANPGSLFPASASAGARFKPLFEDQRARQKGDILTVVLSERTVANRSSNASANKSSTIEFEADLSPLANIGKAIPGTSAIGKRADALGQAINGVGVDGGVEFTGRGAASAQNAFTGTITVTVMDVLANGNLVVAGEKQLAVSSEEEVIRLSGVINPIDLVNNAVTSTRVADLRLEYRGRGFGDDTQQPGWFTRALMKISPF